MSIPFKTLNTPMTMHFDATMVRRWTAWERGPWLLIHEEHGGVKMWTHRLCLYPIMHGRRLGHSIASNRNNTYVEYNIAPDFRMENGAVAAIIYTRMTQELASVSDWEVSDKWRELAYELYWEQNVDMKFSASGNVLKEPVRATRCYIGMMLAQHWLKENGVPRSG